MTYDITFNTMNIAQLTDELSKRCHNVTAELPDLFIRLKALESELRAVRTFMERKHKELEEMKMIGNELSLRIISALQNN